MKVVHLCASDIVGGAAVAAYRLNTALNKYGTNSKMLVINQRSKEQSVVKYNNTLLERFFFSHFRSMMDIRQTKKVTTDNAYVYSTAKYGVNLTKEQSIQEADVIHIHWINAGFMSLKSLRQLKKLNKPIVWTMHDMWAFTGGCHYSGECEQYKQQCASCYMLKPQYKNKMAKKILNKKERIYQHLNITAVGCSNWMVLCAKQSSLLKNKAVIALPNCIDTEKYRVIERNIAKIALGLDANKKYVLFGAINGKSDVRKGYKLLKQAIECLAKQVDERVELLVFGSDDPQVESDFAIKTKSLGFVNDERVLMLTYNAADVFVSPSMEDNLPNTMVEALACGTPIVAFNLGGIPDLVEHKKTGYLAETNNVEALATGIQWCLNTETETLRQVTRQKAVETYDYQYGAENYRRTYQRICKIKNTTN